MTKSKKPTLKSHSAVSRVKPKPNLSGEPKSSKSNTILTLLRRKQGASLEEIQKTSGWQTHSVRGFLSGMVKKRLGLVLNSSKVRNGEYVISGC